MRRGVKPAIVEVDMAEEGERCYGRLLYADFSIFGALTPLLLRVLLLATQLQTAADIYSLCCRHYTGMHAMQESPSTLCLRSAFFSTCPGPATKIPSLCCNYDTSSFKLPPTYKMLVLGCLLASRCHPISTLLWQLLHVMSRICLANLVLLC